MVNVLTAAGFISAKYSEIYHSDIDEMKLHKLLYFAQRESLIQNDLPLFNATFYGWKYGPVLKEVREAYHNRSLPNTFSACDIEEMDPIMRSIFENYASKDSWSLSRLSHGEYSWQKSREGIAENSNSDNPIELQDIRKDAVRIKERRMALVQLGLA